ncbi:MAG: hypothetical protein IT249_08405 [Chitinophagaceae bacterium]|nr:hypothetical protein [Chitinophagaceae bacterium]
MNKNLKNIPLLILFVLLCFSGKAETQYKYILVSNNIVWALTSNGSIKLFDATNGKQIDKNIYADTDIILITKDKTENFVIANKRKQIKKYDQSKNTWEVIGHYDIEPFGIFVDSKGTCFSVTEKGIQDLTTKKFYFNDKSLNHQIHYKEKWGKPYCSYIDKKDIIWLGFGYGEWGGNLFAFQTSNKKFLDLSLESFEIELFPIKSFFEDSSSLYISAGLDHMMTSGIIVKMNDLKAEILYNSESHWLNREKRDTMINGEYIGPSTFSPYNNSIYFYSQNGVFLGDKSKDLSKSENWTKIISPKLSWKYGQPDAVGSPMNVLKLYIVDKTKFVFLSQNNGIGFYDGQKIVMR